MKLTLPSGEFFEGTIEEFKNYIEYIKESKNGTLGDSHSDVDFEIEGTTLKKYIGNKKDVVIPYGISKISDGAFSNTIINSIYFPNTVKEIGIAFQDCEDLERVVLNEGVEILYSETFMGCKNLIEISLPKLIVWLEEGIFSDCHNVKCVDCNGNKKYSFVDGCLIKNGDTIIQSFGNIIPDNPKLTAIESGAFYAYRCPCLHIPNNIKVIYGYAFEECDFETIKINGDVHIKTSSFFNCEKLTQIEISSNCKNIEEGAFEVPHNNMINVYVDSDEIPDNLKKCVYFSSYSPDCTWVDPELKSGSHFIYNMEQFVKSNGTIFPKTGFVAHREFYDIYYIGHGYNIDGTLKVTIEFASTDNKHEYPVDYNTGDITVRKIDLSNVIVDEVDYSETIIVPTDYDSFQELYMGVPITFTMNSKELKNALKDKNKITLKFNIIEFTYENEEDLEDNYYIDDQIIDGFKFDVLL